MTRVAGVGFSCVDVYPHLDKYYPTGNGVDFCIHLSRLGIETGIISVVGTDQYGELMLDELQEEGIDTSPSDQAGRDLHHTDGVKGE